MVITNNINSYKNTNIKGINLNTERNHFSGIITVYIQDLEHLNRLIERLKKIHGIYLVERFESSEKEK